MKRIKESAKITLTLGQLKRLVKEGFDGSTDSEYIVKNLRDYACNEIIGGKAEEIMNPDSDGRMRRPLTDTREVERYARDVGFTKVCVLGDELDFRHNSIEYTLYRKNGEYAVLCTELERGNGYRIHLYVVKLEGELADDARKLDDSESVAVKETAEVSGFKRDSLGCEFMGRFGSMRKPQSWVIYPKGSAPDGKVYIQCKNRWGELDVDSGILWMSAAHGFANNISLTIDKVKGKAERIELDRDTVDQIVDAMNARDGKRATGPERDTLLVVGDDEPEGKGPWSDPDYADYVR